MACRFACGLRIRYAAWPASKRRVLIIAQSHCEAAERLRSSAWTGLELAGFLSDASSENITAADGEQSGLGRLADAPQVVAQLHIDEVLVALPLRAHQEMVDLIVDLQRLPVSVRVVPDLFDLAFARTGIENLDGIPIVSLRDPAITPLQRMVKRLFDLMMGSISLIVCAIPMALIALAIKRVSPGPVIFRKQRIGENRKMFWMLKFRTIGRRRCTS
jgi:FlaA1/EpsC-like NDP-sugar epimerase